VAKPSVAPALKSCENLNHTWGPRESSRERGVVVARDPNRHEIIWRVTRQARSAVARVLDGRSKLARLAPKVMERGVVREDVGAHR
jgi:hypothetical protein